MNFTQSLLRWYKNNYRDLPWKHTNDPYKIWLSEIIMQQTRVEQGMPYYLRFVAQYPTIRQLAAAPIDDVLKLWQGLGYYSRARNLHYAALQVLDDYDGKFPSTYAELLKLKGVGTYTAAAIASFAFKEPVAAIDGNGYRILTRFFGIDLPIDTTTCKKQITLLAQELVPEKEPDAFNQALMDFGSAVCTPQKPACETCPLQIACAAYTKNMVAQLPVKSKKIIVRPRYFHYLLLKYGKNTYLRKRDKKDIWQGLYEFPMIETETALTPLKLFKTNEWMSIIGTYKPKILYHSLPIKHQLSHQTIWATFFVLDLTTEPTSLATGFQQVSISNIANYAFPQLIERTLHQPEISIFFA